MPNWTKEQQLAIDKEGKNIIVSAGAGSGKTAVLTERVIRKLKDGVDIDKLLVLTFTNEASNEMKNRIRKAIEKEVSLKKQLDYIDSSYITTFDSYAFSVVKKYHYVLGLSKDLKIIDSSVINIKKEEFIEEIFNELYEEKDQDFLKLINDFTVKDDKDLRNIYNRLAKEGAKLKIGISYSTQEVSSISPSILKNTQNWFISHLNNRDEIRVLEKYYDFSDFSQSIIRNSDIGFARVKTFSNNFIIPVQIEKFRV